MGLLYTDVFILAAIFIMHHLRGILLFIRNEDDEEYEEYDDYDDEDEEEDEEEELMLKRKKKERKTRNLLPASKFGWHLPIYIILTDS